MTIFSENVGGKRIWNKLYNFLGCPKSPRFMVAFSYLCLVHIWLAMGLRSPYPAPFPCGLREASLRRQEAAVRFSYGFTGSAASTIWFSEKFYKLQNIVSPWTCVVGVAQFPHGHRAKGDHHTGSIRFPCGGCGDCTATALTFHDFRTISTQSLYGFTPGCPRDPVEEIARCP